MCSSLLANATENVVWKVGELNNKDTLTLELVVVLMDLSPTYVEVIKS